MFGLLVTSDIKLQEAEEQTGIEKFDVIIQYGKEVSLDRFAGGYYSLEDTDFYFYVPEAAVYCISSGSRITVSPVIGADEAKIRLFLLGTCIGILLMQRRIIPLHGSVVTINGKAYAVVGESGAGKSTLAAAFIARGYPLLTDDVIAVRMDAADDVPVVHPSYPQQKLWQASLDHFGREANGYSSIYQRANKFAIPIRDNFCSSPLPLAGIFELSKTEDSQPALLAYSQMEGLHILNVHTYRIQLIHMLQLQQWHFGQIARLAAAVPVYRLIRPAEGFTAFELVQQIVNEIQKEEVIL
ncbi:aldolase [Paenibacillus protaetiae]|uniref:Aldolase n=1 Tax=Paenibacillus protaetiae TaxID=2509456 RepID=A0A4P6EW03_9BACL|nr:aldolase [Paenibacillus protaetiae]